MEDGSTYEEDATASPEPSLFALMDEFAKTVEIFTGFKQQFMAAGWDEKNAEEMVLQFLRTTALEQLKGKQ